MKEQITLEAEIRTTGKSSSRALRTSGKVPAVIYGANTKNQNLFVDAIPVKKYNTRAYENALFTLKSKDNTVNGKVVLMKDVTVHPVTQKPMHIDFLAIDVTKTIRVFIEVIAEGKAIGIAEGGLLNVVTRQVEVECLPTAIPGSVKVDVSNLGLGMSLHVSDIQLPTGVKMISAPELTVCVVNKEEEKATATEAAPAAVAAATPAAAAKATPAAAAKAPAAPAKK